MSTHNFLLAATIRELNNFLYSISCNLRKPLYAIADLSQILKKRCEKKLDSNGRKYLTRLYSEIVKMNMMFDEIEKLYMLSKTKLNKETVDLTKLVISISRELQKKEPDRKIKFKIAPGIKARGDPKLLRLVFEILLDNAWKFSIKKESALIEFGVQLLIRPKSSQKVYYIRDTGIGYDKKVAGKMFCIFGKLHNEKQYPGTGSGLAFAQRIIHLHKGWISPDTTLNKGAVFYFTLNNTWSKKKPKNKLKRD